MTDEERQELCEWLHRASVGWGGNSLMEHKMAHAAEEIERLAKELERIRINYEEENSSAQRQWIK
jgi:hypothetical protein